MHIDPTPAQLEAFVAGAQGNSDPVFMLNLLKFKEQADGLDAGKSGIEAYMTYAGETAAHLGRVGGELLWAGACTPALIGPEQGEWDVVAIVRYPTRQAFIDMVSDPDYLASARHRSAGLADSRLVPCGAAPLG